MFGKKKTKCNKCENCLEITAGTSIDVAEIDGASNRGIDEIRQLREAVKFIPVKYKYKVYIIDEVHMLTEAASNALLKTLEEPPSYVVFIFATTDAHKIMPTILSRCQRYDFKKIPFDGMRGALEQIFRSENVSYDMNALNLIIRHSEGCMRDALSFSDQIISYTSGNVNYTTVAQMLGVEEDPVIGDLFAAVLREDASVLEDLIRRLCDAGISLSYAAEKMISHTRNLLLMSKGAAQLRKELTADESAFYDALLKDAGEHRLFALFQLLQKLHADLKYSSFARYAFEFGLYKAASLSRIVPLPVPGDRSSGGQKKQDTSAQPKPTAPAQAQEKTPPAQSAAGPVQTPSPSLSAMDKRWHDILRELNGEIPALAAVLQHATLTEYGSGKVTVQFPKERIFQYTRASNQENQAALKAFLQRKLGDDVALEIRGGENEKKKPLIDKKIELESLYEKKIKREVAETPLMQHLLEIFEAKAEDIKVNKKEL